MRYVVSALVLSSMVACSPAPAVKSDWSPSPAPPAEGDPATVVAPNPETVAQMHALLKTTETLRDQAAMGKSDDVRAAAAEFVMSLKPDPDTPQPWRDPLARIRTQAEVLARHETDAEAAGALANIARACGDCHVSADAQERVATALHRGPAPEVGSTEAAAMRVHGWSTQHMWDSLVVPDKDRWVEGTTMFVLLPSCVDLDPEDEEHNQRCKRAHAVARRAHVVDDLDGRTSLMGDLLTTCAPCHRAATTSGD